LIYPAYQQQRTIELQEDAIDLTQVKNVQPYPAQWTSRGLRGSFGK
jgi:hypothetical protein